MNKSFSPANPRLQHALDSTSLSNFEFCPTYYKRTNLEGWRGESVDLIFGGFFASALERYQKARLEGLSKLDAMLPALRWLLEATWQDGNPWGGHHEEHWRCTGTEKYRNKKGNAAKCPFSHKGATFPDHNPGQCGECGSPTESVTVFNTNNGSPAKNRQTLIRLFIWYVEEQPETLTDGLHPIRFPDGTPAVELTLQVPLGRNTPYGEPYTLNGHLDYFGQFGDEIFPVDNKSTTKTLNESFFGGYNPSLQLDNYDLMVSILYPGLTDGVAVDAAQTMVSGARFARRLFYKTESQREEQLGLVNNIIDRMELAAETGSYHMNKRNCWLCPLKNVCALPPEGRDRELETHFTKGPTWDPLTPRTEMKSEANPTLEGDAQ